MPRIFSDDIGSYPLPAGVKREGMQETALKIVSGSCPEDESDRFKKIIAEIIQQKISSGLARPNYPQVQNMIDSFFSLIEAFPTEEPWLIQREKALIPEVEAIKPVAEQYYKENNAPLEFRVCVTGPLDLYIAKAGTQIEPDLLKNVARSVSSFIENSMVDEPYLKTKTVSIDEPSLGLNPNLIFNQDDLIEAWDIATKGVNVDIQIHLHSPAEAEIVYQTEKVKIIGVESAEDQRNLEGFEKSSLEDYDRFLRVGIARTNINGLASDYQTKTGINVWQDRSKLIGMVNEMESPKVIVRRLEKAFELFGDRVLYAGPDCGLGLWPSQESAKVLLENTVKAVDEFNKKKE